jgi:hypothetical protein
MSEDLQVPESLSEPAMQPAQPPEVRLTGYPALVLHPGDRVIVKADREDRRWRRQYEERRRGLVDMGLPPPKGTAGKWDDPPVDFDG